MGRGGPPRARRQPDAARAAAYRAIAGQVKVWPDLALDGLADDAVARLSPLDAAFAHALYDTVLRRWLTLRYVLEQVLSAPFERLDPPTAAALLCGTAQIIFFDKVPVHSAVDESVNWAGVNSGPRGAGMTNAVLRRIAMNLAPPEQRYPAAWTDHAGELPLTDGSAVRFFEPFLPSDAMQRLAVVTSHSIELLRAIAKAVPSADLRPIALHSLLTPPVVLNTAHATGPLPSFTTPHEIQGHHVFAGPHAELKSLLSARPDVWVQDAASTSAVRSAAHLKPRLIIDWCAGMGTKTRQLAATFPEAEIVATDTDARRRRELARQFEGHARVKVPEPTELGPWAGRADLILLDVPCTNTGVLARRVEARYRFSAARTHSLVATQRQIMNDAVPFLDRSGRGAREPGGPGGPGGAGGGAGGSGGVILYSTCSLDAEENQEQAKWACRWHGFTASAETLLTPRGVPGSPASEYSDGAYHVLLS